jgi:hypothetical protein
LDDLLPRLISYFATDSPKKNPNLLQRSEIVALVNTMHRLSESLYAVETFRKMYADTQKDEQARLADVKSEQQVRFSLSFKWSADVAYL